MNGLQFLFLSLNYVVTKRPITTRTCRMDMRVNMDGSAPMLMNSACTDSIPAHTHDRRIMPQKPHFSNFPRCRSSFTAHRCQMLSRNVRVQPDSVNISSDVRQYCRSTCSDVTTSCRFVDQSDSSTSLNLLFYDFLRYKKDIDNFTRKHQKISPSRPV